VAKDGGAGHGKVYSFSLKHIAAIRVSSEAAGKSTGKSFALLQSELALDYGRQGNNTA
jgi:hypothetical protein